MGWRLMSTCPWVVSPTQTVPPYHHGAARYGMARSGVAGQGTARYGGVGHGTAGRG